MTIGMSTGAETVADSGFGVGEVEAGIGDCGAETADSGVDIVEVEAGIGDSGAETADSGVEIEVVDAGIGDSVAAVGYQDIRFALGIDNPAGPDAIVQPWW
jgi:hypothetical protein